MITSTALWPTWMPRPVDQLGPDPGGAVSAARGLVDVDDLPGQPDSSELPRGGRPVLPRVVAGLRDRERSAGVANIDSLPGESLDHREEAFGASSGLRKTSLTFLATAGSVSSWRIRRLAAANSIAWSVLSPSLTTIDLVLVDPVVDRCFADPEGHGKLLDTRPGPSQLDHLTTHLRRVPARHLNLRIYRTTLETRLHHSRSRSPCAPKRGHSSSSVLVDSRPSVSSDSTTRFYRSRGENAGATDRSIGDNGSNDHPSQAQLWHRAAL